MPKVILSSGASAAAILVYGAADHLCNPAKGKQRITTVAEIMDLLATYHDERTVRAAIEECEDRCWLATRRDGQKAWEIEETYNPARIPPINLFQIDPPATPQKRPKRKNAPPKKDEAGNIVRSERRRCGGTTVADKPCLRFVKDGLLCPVHDTDAFVVPMRATTPHASYVATSSASDVAHVVHPLNHPEQTPVASKAPGGLLNQQSGIGITAYRCTPGVDSAVDIGVERLEFEFDGPAEQEGSADEDIQGNIGPYGHSMDPF